MKKFDLKAFVRSELKLEFPKSKCGKKLLKGYYVNKTPNGFTLSVHDPKKKTKTKQTYIGTFPTQAKADEVGKAAFALVKKKYSL